MLRLRTVFAVVFVLSTVSFLRANDSDATYVVGTCKPRLTSFASISAAVSSVPSGSTILVCPGVYAEQVTIAKPLSLQGIASANQDQAIIAIPGGGATSNSTSIFGQPVAAQVLVQAGGFVNISNISVDGTNGDMACTGNTWLAGIFYASGSSGEVSRAKVSNEIDGGCGVGVWAENGNNASQFVTIEDSSIHDVDGEGIFTGANSLPGLNLRVRDNVISPNAGLIGIILANVAAKVEANEVSNAFFGIANLGTGASISSNTVSLANAGIVLEGGGTATSNRISNSSFGVWFFGDGGTVQSNRITNTSAAGIEFNCHAAAATHNSINDAVVGLDQVPAGFQGTNRFSNTATVRNDTCAAAAVRANGLRANAAVNVASTRSSILQWRTPASPQGALK